MVFCNFTLFGWNCFRCMYSVTSSQTFKEVPNLYDHLRRVKDDKEFPFVLVGTKCDLENDREVPREQGEELARKLGVKFLETSAKTKVLFPEHWLISRLELRKPFSKLFERYENGEKFTNLQKRKANVPYCKSSCCTPCILYLCVVVVTI